MIGGWRAFARRALLALLCGTVPLAAGPAWGAGKPGKGDKKAADGEESASRISDEVIPLQLEDFPERPRFLVELGNPYLGTGTIRPGAKLPTGAIWQPSLIVWGTLRTAAQSFEDGGTRVSELATRLDLFANLQLSGTERLVVALRPLDSNGAFTSYILDPSPGDPAFDSRFRDGDRFQEALNAQVRSFFFEGDFGEIFPRLDQDDSGSTDVGFSIGRQQLIFQEGLLINDSIDGIGLTRNSLQPAKTSNFRATLLVGVGDVDRGNVEDKSAEIYGFLTSWDTRTSTIDADLAIVDGDSGTGDLAAFGVSAVQRLGLLNTSFRLLASTALGDETAVATDGGLLFSEISWTPHKTHDLAYVNAFVAVDEFSSAARGPDTGGPLGRAGVNFAAVGLGSYGAPLDNRARDVVGGALGYQRFWGPTARRQLLAELGLRVGTATDVDDAVAVTLRYQAAFGKHLVHVTDVFGSHLEPARSGQPAVDAVGGRFELLVKF